MSFKDDFQDALKKAKEARPTGLIVHDGRVPLKGNELRVYNYCKNGHVPVGGEYGYVGATDEEMAEVFTDLDHNTIRWVRYRLYEKGYLKYSGIRRNVKPGKPASKVWVIGEGKPQKIKKINLKDCFRCGQEHSKLVIKEMSFCYGSDSLTYIKYWATCPTTKEPILLDDKLGKVG